MKGRCYNPKVPSHKRYGARGITVCERWKDSFPNFLEDMGQPPPGKKTLGRIDNDAGYGPDNCRWESLAQQGLNRSNTIMLTLDGVTKPLMQWTRERGVSYAAAINRLNRGHAPEEVLRPGRLPRHPVTDERRARARAPGKFEADDARAAVHVALHKGLLKKLPCQHPGCGSPDSEAHHAHGYDPDNALNVEWLCTTHHPRGNSPVVVVGGVEDRLCVHIRDAGMAGYLVRARIGAGMSASEAISTPVKPYRRVLTFGGETMSKKRWAEKLGVSLSAFANRLKKGLPDEEVFVPSRKKRKPPMD